MLPGRIQDKAARAGENWSTQALFQHADRDREASGERLDGAFRGLDGEARRQLGCLN